MQKPKIVYAANRQIGVEVLKLLIKAELYPICLIVPKGKMAQFTDEMRELLPQVPVLEGKVFRESEGIKILKEIEPDYILSIHFPLIIPPEVLKIPRIGVLNLHPSYLPYNRGWHTPTWAIIENTPFGATLHWVDEGIDTGDIAIQRKSEILPQDTADSLYKKAVQTELEIMEEAIELLKNNSLPRIPQKNAGTFHKKEDLKSIQKIDLNEKVIIKEFLNKLRALTTNNISESAYFIENGKTYHVQIKIIEM